MINWLRLHNWGTWDEAATQIAKRVFLTKTVEYENKYAIRYMLVSMLTLILDTKYLKV